MLIPVFPNNTQEKNEKVINDFEKTLGILLSNDDYTATVKLVKNSTNKKNR